MPGSPVWMLVRNRDPLMSVRSVAVLATLGTVLLALPGFAQTPKLLPTDDSASDPSFKKVYDKLLKVVANRDAKALLKFLDPDIKLSFGGMGGIAEFKEMWRPADPKSEVWEKFDTVLRLGVVRSGDGPNVYFSAPYSFTRFPDEYDPFDYGVIVSENAQVRSQPDAQADVVFSLSYDIIKLIEWISDKRRPDCHACGWYRIETLDGRAGFVSGKDARSPIDYRVIFMFRDGRWRITAFVAGD